MRSHPPPRLDRIGSRSPICRHRHSDRLGRSRRLGREPRRAPRSSALPAQKQAAGVQSAWLKPSPSPPNDHADWATLGRQGRSRRPEMKSHPPERHAFSRKRDSSRYETDGQARCPPPQSSQMTADPRSGSGARATLGRRGRPRRLVQVEPTRHRRDSLITVARGCPLSIFLCPRRRDAEDIKKEGRQLALPPLNR